MIDSITEYAKLANITLADRVRANTMLTELNAATGIASEAGEINEITKKRYFHDHPNTGETIKHMEKELGDLIWYWALMCFSYNLEPAQVLQTNIDKLKARYPEGFSTERSMNRAEGDI
jgi:NTP pyrophosphatase (non-canonical NTP hydrolase)